MGKILSVADVEAEMDGSGPARDEGKCPAEHEVQLTEGVTVVSLRCWEDAGHPRPHRDKVHGLAWDDSPMTLPWPAHTAALIVRDLIDAGEEAIRDPGDLDRWHSAISAAEYLPGVAREDEGT
jgi:hypothetical protein